MKVLIAYRTRYGTTESCARRIGRLISAEVVLHDLRSPDTPALEGFDAVLIGGSIYGGRVQREVSSFCERRQERLSALPVGLFICCFFEGEKGMAELNAAFPPWLTAHAFARELLGGALTLSKLSLADRLLVRGLMRPPRDVSAVRDDAIERLAAAVAALPG